MSLKELGNLAKSINELNNATGEISKSKAFDNVLKHYKEKGYSAEQIAKDLKNRGASQNTIDELFYQMGKSDNFGFTPKEAYEAKNKIEKNGSVGNKNNASESVKQAKEIANAMDSIPESANKAGDSVEEFDKKANLKDAEKSTTGFASKFKTSMKDSVEKHIRNSQTVLLNSKQNLEM